MAATALSQITVITDWLIPQFEGFSPSSYWDVSRWSIGYGTQAAGPGITITKQQALEDMREVVQANYAYLRPMITRELSPNQWAALMSFAYNLGPGNADNLVDNINSGDDAALGTQWMRYVMAGGVENSALVKRRAKEWEVWQG